MTIQQRLETVNEGTLFICFCMFCWILLLSAQADSIITLPYWALFFPLWVWKLTVFVGWLCGIITWCRQRRHSLASASSTSYPYEDLALPHIQAMSVSTFFTLLLGCSEVLLCIHLMWPSLELKFLTILTPLMLVGVLGIFAFFFVMIDSRSVVSRTRRYRNRISTRSNNPHGLSNPADNLGLSFSLHRTRCTCSFTLELFIAANLLQLLLLVALLDGWIQSKWLMTFIPTFILLGISFMFCTIGFFVALIRYFFALLLTTEQRRMSIIYYASHIVINILLCCSMVSLAFRLDRDLSASQASYTLIASPVLLSLVLYAIMAFYVGPGNPWWFGLNRNISLALFETCSTLQLCANTSVTPADLWKFSPDQRSVQDSGVTTLVEDVMDSVPTNYSPLFNPAPTRAAEPVQCQSDGINTISVSQQQTLDTTESTTVAHDLQPMLFIFTPTSCGTLDVKPTENVHYPD